MIERVLRRDRWVIPIGLICLFALSVAYLVSGAGLGMSFSAMTNYALFPHTATGASMGMMQENMSMGWSLTYALLILAMWWVMMIAMMTPSATPMILLFAGVTRSAISKNQLPSSAVAHTWVFLAGYLIVWLAFSVAAAALQWALEQASLLSSMSMWSSSSLLSAAVLLAAGLYQWTPLKDTCLRHCRAPASFLSTYWRPGALGAFGLGVRHGAYCVGCCWALMALLFVGGVMNPVWIAAIAILVLLEKTVPGGRFLPRLTGLIFIAWAIATLWV